MITVIACTTMETIRVSEPVAYYQADRLRLIFMNRKGSAREAFYASLVEEIDRKVNETRKVEVIRHNDTVYSFNAMLRLVNSLISEERKAGNDVYVNISSGTSEFAAAAMCACMMNPGSVPFTVAVKEHAIPFEKFVDLTSREGRPTGDALSVHDPRAVETFTLEAPNEDLVRYLWFFSSIEGKAHAPRTIIRLLDENDIWHYTPTKTANPGRTSDTMQYNRTVLEPLVRKGWLEPGPGKNTWKVTPAGRYILEVFTDEENRRPIVEIVREYDCMRRSICMSMAPRDFEEE